MSTDDDNLKSALLNLSIALREGTPEQRNEAMQRCHTVLESTLDQEDLIGLAIIIRETHSGLRVTTEQDLEYASKEEFHLHIAWDLVLPSLANKQYIALKQSPDCSDTVEIVPEPDSEPEPQKEDTDDQNHIVVLQLPRIESPSSQDTSSGFPSNKQYLMACLLFLDDVIEISQPESEEEEEEETNSKENTSDAEELDARYAQLRSRGKATDPLPPLEVLCDLLDLQRSEFLILLLVVKAELDSNPLDIRTLIELLSADILEQYELKKLLEPDSTLIREKLLFLDDTQRYAKTLVLMPQEVVDYLLKGGTPPPQITDHPSRLQSQGFPNNEHYLDAWLEIARILLGDLLETPRNQTRFRKLKSGRDSPPANEIEPIQQILHRIITHGSQFPLGELVARHRFDDNECIILSLGLYATMEKLHIPVDGVLALLAGDDPFRRVRFESYLSPDAPLVREGAIRIRDGAGKQEESSLYIPRSLLRDILELPQETCSLSSSPFFEHQSPEHTLDDVILPPEIRKSIDTAIASMRPEVMERLRSWGISGSGGSKQLSMVFHGEPGTGKSLCASAIAHALQRTLLSVDAENILSKWHGQSEQNLAKLFETYDQMAQRMERPPVLLLEECDQMMVRRDSIRGTATDISEHRLISIFLEKLERFSGILIGTSNLVDAGAIDEAFSRRFLFKIRFPFPDVEARFAIWQAHIPNSVPGRSDIDLHAIARRFVFSGGQIRIASLGALRTTAIRDGFLMQKDIIDACEAEMQGSFEHHADNQNRKPIGFLCS